MLVTVVLAKLADPGAISRVREVNDGGRGDDLSANDRTIKDP
jgi:hypothetical protein